MTSAARPLQCHAMSVWANSDQVTSRRLASPDVMPCRAVPCRVVWCRVMSCHVMSCHVMSCHVMSCHVMSCHVMSCHAMFCRVLSCPVVYHAMPCHVMSSHAVSCRVMPWHGMACHGVAWHGVSWHGMASQRVGLPLHRAEAFRKEPRRADGFASASTPPNPREGRRLRLSLRQSRSMRIRRPPNASLSPNGRGCGGEAVEMGDVVLRTSEDAARMC